MFKIPSLFGLLTDTGHFLFRHHKAGRSLTLSLLLFAGALLPLQLAAASESGLVGHWPFDEGAGITVTDYSGNGNTGTLLNGSSWTGGKSGYSLSFDGSNDYVEIPHASSLDATSALTVSAWINNESLVDKRVEEYRIIASKGWAPSSGGSWTLAWAPRYGSLIFFVRQSSNARYHYVVLPYSNSEANQWRLITAIFDQGTISLYQDGVLKAGPVNLGSSMMRANTDPIRIGSIGKSTSWLRNWAGLIDDVRVYNRPLTEAEITTLYLAGQEPVASVPFNFSLSNSGGLATAQGSSATTTITSALSSGTSQSVSFSLSGLPQGATASLSKTTCNPSCSTLLTVSASSSTPIGTYPLIVAGNAGNVRDSTTVSLAVTGTSGGTPSETPPSQNFDFSLGTGSTATMSQSSSDYSVITANLLKGSSQPISFSASGFPASVSQSFSSGSCSLACKTNLQMTVAASAQPGSYPVTVTATGGGVTRTAKFTLTIVGANTPSTTTPNTPATVATPTISPASGSYNGSISVTIQSATAGAAIYYTTNGSTPTQASTLYTGAITLANSAVIKSKAFKSGSNPSAETNVSFSISAPSSVATPTISPAGGSYPSSVSVTMQSATTGAAIYYTTNSSTPTQASTLYTGAITLANSAVIKSKAFKSGSNPSAETSVSFSISPQPPISSNTQAYFVSTTGSDGNPGTESQPFRTINKGISVLKAGGTLYVRAGTYNERINNNIPSGIADSTNYKDMPSAYPTAVGKYTIVMGYPGDAAPVLAPTAGPIVVLTGTAKNYILVKGFRLNATGLGACIQHLGTTDVNATAPHHLIFEDNECWGATGSGAISGQGDQIIYRRLWVHDTGKRLLDHSCYCYPTNSLWEGNIFERSTGYGFHIYGEAANNAILRGNIARYNKEAGILIHSGAQNVQVYNNIVYNNDGWGGIRIAKASRAKVFNNTAYANNGAGIVVSTTDGRDTIIKNNILFQNSRALSDSGTGTVQSHNLTADPRFENASNGDFRLRSGSPAIDAGVTVSEVSTDSQRVPRPRGAGYDIGAVESH